MDRSARNSCCLKITSCNAQCNAAAAAWNSWIAINQSKFMSCSGMLLDWSSGVKHKDFNCDPSVRRLCRAHRTKILPNIATFFPPFSAQNKKAHDPTIQRTIMSFSMPPTGVEPVLCLQKGILSPSCLPISPQRRKNPAYKALLLPQNERAGNNRSEVKIMAARPKWLYTTNRKDVRRIIYRNFQK